MLGGEDATGVAGRSSRRPPARTAVAKTRGVGAGCALLGGEKPGDPARPSRARRPAARSRARRGANCVGDFAGAGAAEAPPEGSPTRIDVVALPDLPVAAPCRP